MKLDRRAPRANLRPSASASLARPRQPGLSLGGLRFWLTLSAIGIVGTLGLLVYHLLAFTRSLDRLAAGLTIADVPVGGLTGAEAEERLRAVYFAPFQLDYRGSAIQLDPAQVNFRLDTSAMLAQAPAARSAGSVGRDAWAYLWNRRPQAPKPVALQAHYDQALLKDFVADIAARYDDPGRPALADPATLGFIPGSPGFALDQDAAFAQVEAALLSPMPADRKMTLPVKDLARSKPTFDTLAELLRTDVRLFQFTGTVHINLADLKTGETLDLAMRDQQPFDVGPGIAYSGMSTIKIPVMVTFFRFREGELTSDEELLLNGVFGESANAYTDLILGLLGDGNGLNGASLVSDTMAELGLHNTYLAGLLDTLGAVTAPRRTPANARADIDLLPDPYNQTSADDMGRLLVTIYQCTQGGGPLMETFAGQFAADECRKMIDLLLENDVGPIFIAGGSPGARVAHKHGWDRLPLNNVGDAALVFTPGGDYAMAVYVHSDEPVPFERANRLIISLATAVFNYFNNARG